MTSLYKENVFDKTKDCSFGSGSIDQYPLHQLSLGSCQILISFQNQKDFHIQI